MPTITATQVSHPRVGGGLNLCKGFPLYPIGSFQAGISSENTGFTVINQKAQVIGAQVYIKLTVGFYAGICGPAYATDLSIDGVADATHVNLNATKSTTVAGMEIGLGLSLTFTFDFGGWAVPDIKVAAATTLDLITILIDAALGHRYASGDVSLPSGLALAAVERDTDTLARTGSVTLRPEFFAIFDLIQFIPSLKPIITFLKKIGGSLDVGPTINVVMPVTISATKVRSDGHEYDVVGGTNKLTGNRARASSVGPNDVEVVFTHQSSVEFGFGLGFELTVFKLFSFERHTKPLDILSLLRVPVTTSPIDNSLKSPIGSLGSSNYQAPLAPHESHSYEVVFEESPMFASV